MLWRLHVGLHRYVKRCAPACIQTPSIDRLPTFRLSFVSHVFCLTHLYQINAKPMYSLCQYLHTNMYLSAIQVQDSECKMSSFTVYNLACEKQNDIILLFIHMVNIFMGFRGGSSIFSFLLSPSIAVKPFEMCKIHHLYADGVAQLVFVMLCVCSARTVEKLIISMFVQYFLRTSFYSNCYLFLCDCFVCFSAQRLLFPSNISVSKRSVVIYTRVPLDSNEWFSLTCTLACMSLCLAPHFVRLHNFST